jgi:transcriptional regulator with XRE-family HTH domain
MEPAGSRLKRVREKLGLTFRDVERLSQEIADRRDNADFCIALSRLADIENKGTLPSIYRLYSLCAIYRLDFCGVLAWYGVPAGEIAGDALQTRLEKTHPVLLKAIEPDPARGCATEVDPARTSYLGRLSRPWPVPLDLWSGFELRHHRYGLVGWEDWSMHPILQPGALVLIDESRRKVAVTGWRDEMERPIYFLEHRQGYLCGWCSLMDDQILVLPHPASPQAPQIFSYPREIEIVGQVVAVATSLEPRRRRPPHDGSVLQALPGM